MPDVFPLIDYAVGDRIEVYRACSRWQWWVPGIVSDIEPDGSVIILTGCHYTRIRPLNQTRALRLVARRTVVRLAVAA